ncbi:hypothetical protein DACRYDRAFT_19895, partial [Dacryopinax primogenitus]
MELLVGLAALLLLGGVLVLAPNGSSWAALAFMSLGVIGSIYLLHISSTWDYRDIPLHRNVFQEMLHELREMISLSYLYHTPKSIQEAEVAKQKLNMRVSVFVGLHTPDVGEREPCLQSAHAFGPMNWHNFRMFEGDLRDLSCGLITHLLERTSPALL